MKIKVSEHLTVEDTGSNIILSHFASKQEDNGLLSCLVTIPIEYGKELDNLTYLLAYLDNNKHFGLPDSELDIKPLGIE